MHFSLRNNMRLGSPEAAVCVREYVGLSLVVRWQQGTP